MLFRLVVLSATALVALLVAVSQVHAEPITWSYQGQTVTTGFSGGFGPQVLVAAKTVPKSDVDPAGLVINVNNQAQFANAAGLGQGSSSVTAFQMRVNTDFELTPGFSSDLHTFNLNYAIRDTASGATGSVTFKGTLAGFMTMGVDHTSGNPNFGSADLQVGFTGALQKSLVLGDHLYRVSITPYHFVWGQDLTIPQSSFGISPYQNVPINVQVSTVPEPSTLALLATGLAGLGLRSWRRRRARHEEQPAT